MKTHEEAKKVLDAAAEKDKKPGKHHVHEIHARRAGHPSKSHKEKKGYIARHDLVDEEGNMHTEHPEYPVANMADLQDHMDQHMGDGAGAEAGGGAGAGEEEEPGAQPA